MNYMFSSRPSSAKEVYLEDLGMVWWLTVYRGTKISRVSCEEDDKRGQ